MKKNNFSVSNLPGFRCNVELGDQCTLLIQCVLQRNFRCYLNLGAWFLYGNYQNYNYTENKVLSTVTWSRFAAGVNEDGWREHVGRTCDFAYVSPTDDEITYKSVHA